MASSSIRVNIAQWFLLYQGCGPRFVRPIIMLDGILLNLRHRQIEWIVCIQSQCHHWFFNHVCFWQLWLPTPTTRICACCVLSFSAYCGSPSPVIDHLCRSIWSVRQRKVVDDILTIDIPTREVRNKKRHFTVRHLSSFLYLANGFHLTVFQGMQIQVT
jgi:hypothetical protein